MSRSLVEASGAFGRASLMQISRPVGRHAHPQCHALFTISGDDSLFDVNGQLCPMSADTAVLVGAWQPHAYPMARGRCANVLALYIEPRWMSQLDARFASSARRDFFAAACVRVTPSLRRRVCELAAALGGRTTEPSATTALLQGLMTELAAGFSRYREIPIRESSLVATVTDRRIRRAMSLIAESATARVTMDEVARSVAMSRPHFFAVFGRSLGLAPIAFRNVLRMERAYESLANDPRPIGDIGRDLGFAAHADFTRFFRTQHGVAPDLFRRSVRRI